jgi:hypothetical protein
MTDRTIATSQNLLKRLEEQMSSLRNHLSQAEIISSNMIGTWTAISVTYKNWKSDIEEQ